MPGTSLAFTIGAFGMIGAPPLAGFITKWTIGSGAIAANMHWAIAVLLLSSILNAAYFLPIVQRLWFREAVNGWPHERFWGGLETSTWLLWPPLITALMTIMVGLLASMPFSPLTWAELIAAREYLP
jgi:multicomponent Na+:H+ antiporter subunit D